MTTDNLVYKFMWLEGSGWDIIFTSLEPREFEEKIRPKQLDFRTSLITNIICSYVINRFVS